MVFFLTNVDRILLTKKENFQTKKNSHIHYTHLYIIYIKKDQEEVQVLDDLIFSSTIFFSINSNLGCEEERR